MKSLFLNALFNVNQMCCEFLLSINWISVINGTLSLILLILNGVSSIWGFALKMKHKSTSADKESLDLYINRLELYLNVVTYSDSILVPLKFIFILLAKRFCSQCVCKKKLTDPDSDGFDSERPHPTGIEYTITKTHQQGKISTYQGSS